MKCACTKLEMFVPTFTLVLLYRYYNAWIETFSAEQFKKHSGVDLSIQSDLSFSGSGDETSESRDSDSESEEELSGHDDIGEDYSNSGTPLNGHLCNQGLIRRRGHATHYLPCVLIRNHIRGRIYYK